MSRAEQYARWVLDPVNSVRTGRLMKLAAQRFLNDLQRDDIYFDEAESNKMIGFAEGKCCLWEDKWAGKPMDMRPWMTFIFQQVYGWIRKSDGLRRVTKVYIQIAKKNAKTTLSGITGGFHLLGDFRVKTPKVFVGANNEDQAKLCVNITGKIIEESPELYKYTRGRAPILRMFNYKENIVNVVLNTKTTTHHRQGFIKALSKEGSDNTSKTAGGKHGINPSLGIIDEYGLASDDNLLSVLESAQAAREEPLIMCITTAGYNMEGPCFVKLRKSGIGVLEGTMEDDSYLPFIFELDVPAEGVTVEWLLANEDVWEQCNPNIDVSVFRKFLRDELIKAKNEGGTKEVNVMTLNFNMWVNSPDVFISSEVWDQNNHGLTIEPDEQCYAGLEVGASGQITAVCIYCPGEINRIRMIYIIAEDTLKTEDFYREHKNFILVDAGNEVDNEFAVQKISAEFSIYNLHSFCFPNTQKNNSIVQGLIKAGWTGNPIAQGVSSISNPTSEWEKLVRAGKIDHGNDPILKWMNSNCLAVRKEAGTRVEKNGKVLGIYACINAVAQWQSISATETDDKLVESW